MRVNIWIPDDLMEGVKEAAWEMRASVSGYLVALYLGNKPIQEVKEKLKIIPSKNKKKDPTATEEWMGGFSKFKQLGKKNKV